MERRLITGSTLHDLVSCDHCVALDLRGDPKGRDEVSEFVELPREGGVEHGLAILKELLAQSPGAVDLRFSRPESRQALTLVAVDANAAQIVGEEIAAADMRGRPDLLRRDRDGYIAGDMNMGVDGYGRAGVSRLRYAVQVCRYSGILERCDRLSRSVGFIIDGAGSELKFALDVDLGGTWNELADVRHETLSHAHDIVDDVVLTQSVQVAECRNCHWHSACKANVIARDDLKYPEVATAEWIEALLPSERRVDLLYDVVAPNTDWPRQDFSVTTLTDNCGSAWRNSKPSSAASMRWYRDWQLAGGDAIRTRPLEYNEDDNLAVVPDALHDLPVRA